MRRRACLALLLSGFFGLWSLPLAAQAPEEPAAYRTDNYKAPTPKTLRGAEVVTTAEAYEIWRKKGAVFIDVLAHTPRPAGLPADTMWRDPPHNTIAQAHWLPEVGRGELAAEIETYLKDSLSALTQNDKNTPLLFFCRRECWMSWNAAKRVLSYGYTRIYWYPDGVEGWGEAGFPMEVTQPRP